jgi:NAD(P)-dependent dehydrogenase (short-subunit alcohol dehydrogenase family)
MGDLHFELKGKKILLVGATGVLGRGYASAFADLGAHLAIADRQASDVLEFGKSINAHAFEMDISDERSVVNGVKAVHECARASRRIFEMQSPQAASRPVTVCLSASFVNS